MDILSYILGKKSGSGGGGGITLDDWFSGLVPVGEATFKAKAKIPSRAIGGRTNMTKLTIDLTDGYSMSGWSVQSCASLTTVVIIFPTPYTNDYLPGSTVYDCNNVETIVLRGQFIGTSNQTFMALSKLSTCDIEYCDRRIDQNTFANTALSTLILRQNSVAKLNNTNAFNNTYFASGKSGGDIYIPKTLYDALGTGTESDYKAASNWSTMDSYGTITWHAIEGSYYETHYADGTLIK